MGQVETGSGRSNSPLPKGLLGLLYDKMVPEVQINVLCGSAPWVKTTSPIEAKRAIFNVLEIIKPE